MTLPLWVKSNASFLTGASHPEELVATAAAMGHGALALTDLHGMYGVVRAHVAAKKAGIHLLVGAEVRVARLGPVVLLAPHMAAYGNLCQLLSGVRLVQAKHAAPEVDWAVLAPLLARFGGGTLALCPSPALLPRLAPFFDREDDDPRLWALAVRHHAPQDAARELALVRAARANGAELVAGTEVLYHVPERRALLDVLTCIQTRTTLQTAASRLRPNAGHALLSPDEARRRFADRPAWLHAAEGLAARCRFNLGELRYRYPAQLGKAGAGKVRDEDRMLAARVRAGARHRYGGNVPHKVQAQLQDELKIVAELRYAPYFLSMQDIVVFCRRSGILCQGRGSAANSAVCYCLGITAIDPVQMQLLFSRFLSRARAEPPDIDLDIEHQRREEVIQWLYARQGRRHAAMVANVVRFRWRSAVREVGRVLGIDTQALAFLGRRLALGYDPMQGGFQSGGDVQAFVREAGLDPSSVAAGHLLRLSATLLNFPRHLSVHPGGFVLGQAPVDTLCPIEPATMPGRTVLQWDKQDVDDVGLFKVDLLGLGALSQIHRTFALLGRHEGRALSMAGVPQNDRKTYAMLCRADTVGVFQVESRAQMGMLPRLKPRAFYDLVVQVAIVRPGPIQGNMVHPYLRQRESNTEVRYPHPSFRQVLHKTYGVPIFQEQVMKLAILAAGYDPAEADGLRRDMVAWGSHERLEVHHRRIVDGMRAQGVPEAFAEQLFDQIRGFGAYGFPESHAASFAHIVYVTAYLRCHHLAAFTCALLNAQPMGFYSPATVVADARRHDLVLRPIDVRHSVWDCTLEPVATQREPGADDAPPSGHAFAVRMGLRYVRGLGEREARALALVPPPYRDVDDFVRRTKLDAGALQALVRAGALDGLAPKTSDAPDVAASPADRRRAWWKLRGMLPGRHDALPLAAPAGAPTATLPPLDVHEAIRWDLAASHHSTRGHPVQAWRPALAAAGVVSAAQINAAVDGSRLCHAGVMICRQRPETARGMTFVTLEDETGLVNVVLFPETSERFAVLLQTEPLLAVRGLAQVRHGTVHLIAHEVFVPRAAAAAKAPRPSTSTHPTATGHSC